MNVSHAWSEGFRKTKVTYHEIIESDVRMGGVHLVPTEEAKGGDDDLKLGELLLAVPPPGSATDLVPPDLGKLLALGVGVVERHRMPSKLLDPVVDRGQRKVVVSPHRRQDGVGELLVASVVQLRGLDDPDAAGKVRELAVLGPCFANLAYKKNVN